VKLFYYTEVVYDHQKVGDTHKYLAGMIGLTKKKQKAGKRHTASTCIACILSGPVPWTRNNAIPSSLYVPSGIPLSAM